MIIMARFPHLVKWAKVTITCVLVIGFCMNHGVSYGEGNSEPPTSVKEVGHLGGFESNVTFDNGTGYFLQGVNVAVLQMNGQTATKIANYALPALGRKCLVKNNVLYVTLWGTSNQGYLEIIDVTNPQVPVQLYAGVVSSAEEHINQMWASDGFLYLMTAGTTYEIENVTIVDVSNPATPVVAGILQMEMASFVTWGNYAAALLGNASGSANNRLMIWDISDKTNFQEVYSSDMPYAEVLALDGNNLFVAGDNNRGLKILDISTPDNPVEMGQFGVGTASYIQLAVGNGLAYAGTFNSVNILDVSDTTAPQWRSETVFDPPNYTMESTTTSELAVFHNSRFNLLDATDPANPQLVQPVDEQGTIKGSAITEGHLFVVDDKDMVGCYDLATPAFPAFVHAFESKDANKVFAKDAFLYVADWTNGLMIYNITDKQNPQMVGEYEASSTIINMAFRDNHAYVLSSSALFPGQQSRLEIVDMSDPANPSQVGQFDMPGHSRDMEVSSDGNTVYTIYFTDDATKGLQIVDVSTPEAPVSLLQQALDSRPMSLALTNGHLLVGLSADQNAPPASVDVYNITDPTAPVLINSNTLSTQSSLEDMIIADDVLAVALPGLGFYTYGYDAETGALTEGPFASIPAPREMSFYNPSVTATSKNWTSKASRDPFSTWYYYVLKGNKFCTETTGKYGLNILEVQPVVGTKIPRLFLGVSPDGGGAKCPPEPEERVTIAQGTLRAEDADWLILSMEFEGVGYGPGSEVKSAWLEFDGKLRTGPVGVDENDIITNVYFAVNENIIMGQTATWRLYYVFQYDVKNDSIKGPCALDAVRNYAVAITGNNVSAVPSINPPGIKDPVLPMKLYSPLTTIACAINTAMKPWSGFSKIQYAIDNPGTVDGHTIMVCPGLYEEYVNVDKSLNIFSQKGAAVTWVVEESNNNENTAVDEKSLSRPWTPGDMFHLQADNITIKGFTIIGTPTRWDGSGILLKGNSVKNCQIFNNVIKRNARAIGMVGQGVQENKVFDNTLSDNRWYGVQIDSGATLNEIGTLHMGENDTSIVGHGNVIYHNRWSGVFIYGSNDNKIQYNRIGAAPDDTEPKANGLGIHLADSDRTLILSNRINSSEGAGIHIRTGADSTMIYGNTIGISSSARQALKNLENGIYITRSSHTQIGGQQEYMRNIISGNGHNGIIIMGYTASNNVIIGNYIGLGSSGVERVANVRDGVRIESDAFDNTIGSAALNMPKNYISGNAGHGIVLDASNTVQGDRVRNNRIENNGIGINIHGDKVSNNASGIFIYHQADSNQIRHNIISGNRRNGLYINESSKNIIEHNFIGTDENNRKDLGNQGAGVRMSHATQTVLRYNVISGNISYGISMSWSSENQFMGNMIGVDRWGQEGIPNQRGILVDNSNSNVFGSMDNSDRNTISGNGFEGGVIIRSSMYNHLIKNNIGPDVDGQDDISSYGDGVHLVNADYNTLLMNNIMYNDSTGIIIESSNNNRINNNLIAHNRQAYRITDSRTHTYRNTARNNTVRDNDGNTGFHLNNSTMLIEGNWITGDAYDGIMCENGSDPIIRNNAIFGNAGFGLNNTDPNQIIDATGNWWGQATGPGAGDVSGLADVSDWLVALPSLMTALTYDTLFAAPGTSDSNAVGVQNFQNLSDIVDVTVADDMGWLTGLTAFTRPFSDSLGTAFFVPVIVPEGTAEGAENWVRLETTSQTDFSVTVVDSFLVLAYSPNLTSISVAPDSAFLSPGDSVWFTARARDQYNHGMTFSPKWTASGGTIEDGLYIAGDDQGIYSVTATDSATGTIGTAYIQIGTITAVNDQDNGKPKSFHLFQNYPNPFNPETTIKFSVLQSCHVELKIFDILGHEIETLIDEERQSGYHQVKFDAHHLPTGIYFYRIRMKDFQAVKKMLLLE